MLRMLRTLRLHFIYLYDVKIVNTGNIYYIYKDDAETVIMVITLMTGGWLKDCPSFCQPGWWLGLLPTGYFLDNGNMILLV